MTYVSKEVVAKKKKKKGKYCTVLGVHFAFGGTTFGSNSEKAYCFTTKFIFSLTSSLVLLSDLFICLHSYCKQMANCYEKKMQNIHKHKKQ